MSSINFSEKYGYCLQSFDLCDVVCPGYYNGAGEHNGESWVGGRGTGDRGRAQARSRIVHIRGRGYGVETGKYCYFSILLILFP